MGFSGFYHLVFDWQALALCEFPQERAPPSPRFVLYFGLPNHSLIEENANMASQQPEPENERETQPEPGGVFIRYATISDIDEIKRPKARS